VIAESDVKKGINVLHEEFFEKSYKQINLFIAGAGNVGSKLLDQIAQQQEYLQEHLLLQVRVIALANSRNMLFNEQGIDVKNWKEELQNGKKMDLTSFINLIASINMRNAVFVDITANEEVAKSLPACRKFASSRYCNFFSPCSDGDAHDRKPTSKLGEFSFAA